MTKINWYQRPALNYLPARLVVLFNFLMEAQPRVGLGPDCHL
jgi:hypothetical protein